MEKKTKKTTVRKASKNKSKKTRITPMHVKSIAAILAIILLLAIIIYGTRIFASGKAVAVVNGEKITSEMLEKEYKRVPLEQRQLVTKEFFLNQTLVPTVLLLQEAEKNGISITNGEAEKFVENLLNQSGMTKEDFEKQLSEQGMSYSEFIEFYTDRLKIVKLLNTTPGIPEVSDDEAKAFYNENKASFIMGNKTLPYDELEDQIKSYLMGQKQQEGIVLYVEKLRNSSEIKLYLENIDDDVAKSLGSTFKETNDTICTDNGKPVIRLFSTTTCPHCRWISDTFYSVAKEYMDDGKIMAYHWNIDAKDNTLTREKEDKMPSEELLLFREYSPGGGVPLFVFGCRYVRLGNAYEFEDNLSAEEAEFRYIIDLLVSTG